MDFGPYIAHGLVLLTVGLIGAVAKLLWQTSLALERVSTELDDHDRRITKLEGLEAA